MIEPKDINIKGMTLEEIINRHKHWLKKDCIGWEKMKADLYGADLCGANLCGADLRGANLYGANLYNTDLSYANLYGANLYNTDLSYADLYGANLYNTDLSYANLYGANLYNTDLSYANLYGANLYGADLSYADLYGEDLRGANLCGANLCGANFDKNEEIRKGVKLRSSIIGWKKCKDGVIAKLEIPRGAIVFSINNNKCRTDKAIVKEIIGADRAFSSHKYFSYYVGDVIEVYDFNCEYNIECGEGIHFFRTREEAENYEW